MPSRRSAGNSSILTNPSSPPTPSLARTRAHRTAATSTVSRHRKPYEKRSNEEKKGRGDDDYIDDSIESHFRSEQSKPPRRSLRVVLKMPSSRLREATSSVPKDRAPEPSGRATRNIKKSYVVETSSEEEDDEEDEEQEDYDETNDEIGEEATPNALQEDEEEEEEEEEDEDLDADGDIDMDEDADDGVPLGHQPPPASHTPILRMNPPAAPKTKPKVTLTPAQDTKIKSVESKEIEMEDEEDDDEELSELGSDDEEEVDDEEDAEGEEVEEEEEEEEGGGEEEGDEEDAEGEEVDDDEEMAEADDSRSPDLISRGTTPDINKMTKRQRSRLNEVLTASDSVGGDFLELPMEPQVKKHLTAEEHAMRRAEMARRRKNLSEKRNEEEKQDTINRLLKKQAPKRRGKISAKEIEAQDRGDMSEAEEVEEEAPVLPANPIFVRWVSNAQGCRVGVPVEWLEAPVGKTFGVAGEGKMVEEVQA